MYLLYSSLLAVVFLLGAPYWLFQMLYRGKYRRGLLYRLGVVPDGLLDGRRPSVWVHAVSVGEVLAVSELARQLQAEFPEHRLLVSTTTDTGQELAKARFGHENVFYFPLDFGWVMRRYFRALRPELVIVAETEFWPNFLRAGRVFSTPVALVNARISDRSFPGYRRIKPLVRRVLAGVDLFLAQTQEDARRLIEIGALAERVEVIGNLKFDVVPQAALPIVAQIRSLLAAAGADPVLVSGSTVEGEEGLLFSAFKQVLVSFPKAVMLVAPRHPERFDQVASLCERAGLKCWRRSGLAQAAIVGGVLLVDSIGELASLYALADLAFVGGSLVKSGGHSVIEPAEQGVAIVVGEHTENFRELVEQLQSRNAIRVVSPSELPLALIELLAHGSERQEMGRRAFETVASGRGSTRLAIARLKPFIECRTEEAKPA